MLNDNIYIIPVGSFFEVKDEACFMVYSPLNNKFFLTDAKEASRLQGLLESNEPIMDESIASLIPAAELLEKLNSPIEPDFFSIQLLINEKCNFSCSYCYSADKRSTVELSIDNIATTIDYIHSCAIKRGAKKTSVTFIGGGEPTLSWDLIVDTVNMAREKDAVDGITTLFTLITNGSVFDDDMIQFCLDNDFEIQFSFEVLEDVQNSQRKHYELVSTNLNKVAQAGCNVRVRSTITASNVDRLPEMAAEMITKFPLIKQLSCEPVSDPDYFCTPEIARDFSDRYCKAYLEVSKQTLDTSLNVASSFTRSWRFIKRHFCGPILSVSPVGNIMACSHFSSPELDGFEQFYYGDIIDNKLEINQDTFDKIYNTTLPSKCKSCWARWNCGGGCPNQRYIYKPEVFSEICEQRKRMMLIELMKELAKQYKKTTNNDLFVDLKELLAKK